MARAANAEQVQAWQQRIDSQVRSGLSVAQFCRKQGLQAYNFYFWRRKLANSGQSGRGSKNQGRSRGGGDSTSNSVGDNRIGGGEFAQFSGAGSTGLVPLRIVGGVPSSVLCIRFASGVMVEVPAEMACRTIEQILVTEQALRDAASDQVRGAAC